jgi:Methyltransferase domain
MSAQSTDTAFNADQFQLPYSPGVERHFWNYARNRIVQRHLTGMVSKNQIVLDVGCGPGIVVHHLRTNGLDCLGVELGAPTVPPHLANHIRTNTTAAALPIEVRSKVSTVLLLDVVEHLEQPTELISELQSALPALQNILITVPARMELWSNYDVHFGHFRRYDRDSLRQLAADARLDVLTCKYFFNSLYPAMWIASHRAQQRKLAINPPSVTASTIHAIIGRAFCAEERLPFMGSLFGTSLIGLFAARKT